MAKLKTELRYMKEFFGGSSMWQDMKQLLEDGLADGREELETPQVLRGDAAAAVSDDVIRGRLIQIKHMLYNFPELMISVKEQELEGSVELAEPTEKEESE